MEYVYLVFAKNIAFETDKYKLLSICTSFDKSMEIIQKDIDFHEFDDLSEYDIQMLHQNNKTENRLRNYLLKKVKTDSTLTLNIKLKENG